MGLRTSKGGRQEVLATRGCPGAQQQEALGGEEALEATGPRCSRRLSAGGSAGVAVPGTLGCAGHRAWAARGTTPRLPGGGGLKPRPVAPEPHGLPGPQDTCPQAVARQKDSHVLGQCHQSHEVPAPTTAKAAPAGAGEESQGNPALQLRSGAQAHTCTHACVHTLTCTHRTFCLRAVRLMHTSCLGAPSVTMTACAEPQLTCGPVQGMTTRPGGSQPQGWWKPQRLRFLEPNGAVSVGKSSFPWPVLPSPLQPRALGHTDQSQLREKVGVGTEQRLGSVPGTVLLGRSQPSSPSGAGQGRAARGYPAIRMSFPFDGPSSGEGRGISVSVPEAGTFPGEVKVEHDQACYNPPSPPKVSPWTPKSPPPAHRGTVAR
ncbi:hypothetical protein J1605_009166 [Eschrichtius robustus]|uniref:Uncharacterized protein n=1 Tax=Eschrichtius robustus TaxID=9764 RepID=A0AB34GSM8_ESCRO|nr:hypothetical protein J1605_009166 [Eschrichtius robustus]